MQTAKALTAAARKSALDVTCAGRRQGRQGAADAPPSSPGVAKVLLAEDALANHGWPSRLRR
jgi:hypothetical protein